MALVPDTTPCSESENGEEKEKQLTPHDMWVWNDEFHWKNWHGIWVNWQPLESGRIVKANQSIRALRADNEQHTRLYHRNQWFKLDEYDGYNWVFGPWIMEEETHSLENGIKHPDKDDFRILQFPNGDLGWLQLELKPDDQNCVVFGEVHFMNSEKNGRAPVVLGYDKFGKLGAALMLEETRETNERPEAGWKGNVWDDEKGLQELEVDRKEPQGRFVGKEMILSTKLVMIEREAEWGGFRGGVCEEVGEEYTLFHMPCNFSAFCPKKAAVGKEHAFVAHWIVSDEEVRMISWRYGADGKLQHVKSGTYQKV